MTVGGRPTATTAERRRRSAGALTRLVSVGLRILLVVAVFGSEARAQPLRADHERLPRDSPDATQGHRHPPPFSVDSYDEAVVSHVFLFSSLKYMSTRAFSTTPSRQFATRICVHGCNYIVSQ